MTQETVTKLFTATLSPRARLVTYGVGYGVGLGVPVLLALAFHLSLGEPAVWLLPVPFALTLALARAFRPTGYRIGPETFAVLRPIGEKPFPTAEIASVQYPASRPPGAAFGVVRVEGFYGAWGLYWNRSWKWFRLYVTDDANRVEVRMKDGMRIILSPDDPERFVADLRRALGGKV